MTSFCPSGAVLARDEEVFWKKDAVGNIEVKRMDFSLTFSALPFTQSHRLLAFK